MLVAVFVAVGAGVREDGTGVSGTRVGGFGVALAAGLGVLEGRGVFVLVSVAVGGAGVFVVVLLDVAVGDSVAVTVGRSVAVTTRAADATSVGSGIGDGASTTCAAVVAGVPAAVAPLDNDRMMANVSAKASAPTTTSATMISFPMSRCIT